MTLAGKTARSQTESVSFEFDLPHSPEKVWRALTDPVLLAEWLLPVADLALEPKAKFTFNAPPQPGWDGTVNCRFLEIEAHRKLRYTWVVGDIDTVVTFTLAPTASGTRLGLVQSGPRRGGSHSRANAAVLRVAHRFRGRELRSYGLLACRGRRLRVYCLRPVCAAAVLKADTMAAGW